MKRAMQRFAAFLPAILLGLAAGIGINLWRHRDGSAADAPPPGPVSRAVVAEPEKNRSGTEPSPQPTPSDAGAFVVQFNAISAASPLRSQLAKESFAAGLTLDAFLTMVR